MTARPLSDPQARLGETSQTRETQGATQTRQARVVPHSEEAGKGRPHLTMPGPTSHESLSMRGSL